MNCQFQHIVLHLNYQRLLQHSLQGSLNSQCEHVRKNSSPRGFLQSSQRSVPKCQFEPVIKNSNPKGFLQSTQLYGSKSQFENGRRSPEFEPFAKITNANTEKREFETEIDETGTVNDKVEIKTKQKGRHKVKNKKIPLTIQKLSNHIKFIDYIPTYELITYRHLFAYGFYVE